MHHLMCNKSLRSFLLQFLMRIEHVMNKSKTCAITYLACLIFCNISIGFNLEKIFKDTAMLQIEKFVFDPQIFAQHATLKCLLENNKNILH